MRLKDRFRRRFGLRANPPVATVRSVSPIAEHLARRTAAELAAGGVVGARVSVLTAGAESWHFEIEAADRRFELAFSHFDPLSCRETTPGREKHLVSNDLPPTNDSRAAHALALRLIRGALANPQFPPRDPPVI